MTGSYSLPDLPAAEAVLRDGRRVRLRPVHQDDGDRLVALFERISPHSRYLRFHYSKRTLTPNELHQITHIDFPSQCAYVATLGEGAEERIIGIGRWQRLQNSPSAEIALTVDDTVQMRGLGTVLLEQLATVARGAGLERFEGLVLRQNMAMRSVLDESGFPVTRHRDEGELLYTVDLTHLEGYLRRHGHREHIARSAGVHRLLFPRSVAVIGASQQPRKVGGALLRNILASEFRGPVFPVNPTAASVAGVPAYPSVLDVPGEVDLAVIAVPAPQVLQVVDECARKGVWGLVVLSAGFGETESGTARQRELRDKVLAHGMRLIGPNCLGILNTDPEVSLHATFSPRTPPPGQVSMGSQSGALGLALLDHARSIDLGLAQFVSIGNRVDVSSNDLLEFWEDDPGTDVILLYLESFGNPRNFSRIARRVSRSKPIVVVKGGRSTAGARAATSHTGALATADVAVDALFRQAGVTRVNTIEEMFDVAQVLVSQPLPGGNRVAIVTNAGGPGILAADACEAHGLSVASLTEETTQTLRGFLPAEASLANPVDMIASASPDQFRRTLAATMDDPNVDAVVLIYIPPLVTRPEDIAAAVRDAVGSSGSNKPVVACFMMSRGATVDLSLGQGRYIPSFVFPENAVRALGHVCAYARYREEPEGRVTRPPDVDTGRARSRVHEWTRELAEPRWLPLEAALELLGLYGIPTVETAAATSAAGAGDAAERIGFPVALKLRSSTVTHKTEVGGVRLNLQSHREVEQAYEDVERRLRELGREAEMEGATVQSMAGEGAEVILGMSHDLVMGPLVMVGLGGVQVELMHDVAFSLHPLRDTDPDQLLGQLEALPLLTGWRGRPPCDLEALKNVLLRFSTLIEDLPEIDQVEINPLLVLGRGEGTVAVDARVLVRPHSHQR